MPIVYVVSPWVRPFVKYGIRVGVSRARNFIKWKHYGKRYVRAALGTAALGTAALAGLANMPRSRRDQQGRRLDRFGRQMIMPDGGTYANNPPRKRQRSDGISRGTNPSVMTMSRLSTGRWKSFGQKMSSLVKASMVPYIDKFGRLTNTFDNTGNYPLTFSVNTGISSLPLYMMELNTAPLSAGSQIGAPLMRLTRSAAGLYYFSSIAGNEADNTGNRFAFFTEYNGDSSIAPPSGGGNFGPYMYMDWADIRLSLQGPRKTPSKCVVSLVQFIDDQCQPDCLSTNSSVPSTVPTVTNGRPQPAANDEVNEWNSFWQELIAPCLGNPLNSRAQPTKSKIKTLKSYTYMFQPRSTTDDSITGGIGDIKLLKWFNRVQKTFTFARVNDAQQVTTAEEIDPQETVNDISAGTDTHARPRARLFVMIRSFTPVTADGTTDRTAPDVGCSFDLSVRRKWYFMDHN